MSQPTTYTYGTYKELMNELAEHGRTTGLDQSQKYIDYTRLNLQRMNRVEKTMMISEDVRQKLNNINQPLTWTILTESWCGDAAQNLPPLQAMASLSSHIKVVILLRDENPELMNKHLTNGARSIPKLICTNEAGKEIFTWGPRPAALQTLVMDMIARGVSKDERGEFVQKWYNTDRTQSLQAEIVSLLEKL